MSGTSLTLTPCGHAVSSSAGVIHWCGVPSEIHGVMPPCRWSVARFCLKQSGSWGLSVQVGLRTSSRTVPLLTGGVMATGPSPEPMRVVSTGRKRLPSTPVGSRLWKVMRTGLFLVAAMVGPSHCGGVTPRKLHAALHDRATGVPSRISLYSG